MSISQPISTLTINNEDIALAKAPYISQDGFWCVFDEGTQEYKKSSSKAAIKGNQGFQGKGIKSDVPVEVISDSESEDYGKLRFTLYNPADTTETISVMTSNSVQGVGISHIEEIIDPEDSNYGKLEITTTDPTSGDTETYLTSRIAAGFGEPTATIDNNVGIPSVSVSASGLNTEKVFSFEFHNLKGEQGAQGIQGVQGYQGNMITDIDVVNNEVQFTLHDPKTDTDSTITAGEISPVTVNGVSPSGGNITITGEDIEVSSNNHKKISQLVTGVSTVTYGNTTFDGNVIISNASKGEFGVVNVGDGIDVENGVISVQRVNVDNSLNLYSENPVQNKVITSAIDSVREDMSELVTGVSMVNQKTGVVSLYANDIQIDSSSIVTLKDLIHFDTRNPVISDEDKKYSNSIWINKTTGDVFYYTELNIWGTVYPSWNLLSISPDLRQVTVNDESVRSGAWKSIADLTLPAGKWLLIGNPRWSNGSPNAGTRQMCFSTTSNSNTVHGKNVVVLSGNDTNYISQSSSYIITLSSPSTVYLNVYQTQGGVLTCSAEFQAERVG